MENRQREEERLHLLSLGLAVLVRLGDLLSLNTFPLGFSAKASFHSLELIGGHTSLAGSGDASTVDTVLVIGTEETIAPTERGGEVVDESHVVEIVVFSTRPEGKDVLEGPGEVCIEDKKGNWNLSSAIG